MMKTFVRGVAALPIYPSTNRRLHPLKTLILPGDFEDPFGLANLVDVDVLGGRREFLLDLGARNLSFRAFVHDYLSTLLEDETQNPKVRDAAISLLAERIRELRDDNEIHALLSAIPIVMCADGECRRADDCYFSKWGCPRSLGAGSQHRCFATGRRIGSSGIVRLARHGTYAQPT